MNFSGRVLAAALTTLFAAGCVAHRPDLSEAEEAACHQLLPMRGVELLREIARERSERSRLLRLDGIAAEYAAAPEKFTIYSDPLLEELEFAILYARVMLLPSRIELSRALAPETSRLIRREIGLLLCRLENSSSPERHGLELEIMLQTGWDHKKVQRFNFSTLPDPGGLGKGDPPAAPAVETVVKVIRLLYRKPTPALADQAELLRKKLIRSRLLRGPPSSASERRGILLRLR